MLITDFLANNERRVGEKVALICGSRRQTYAQLATNVRRFANALEGLGIRKGEHVAVLSTNSAEHVEIIFAIAAIGAVWVPLNTRLSPAELSFIIKDSEAVALIYSSDLLASVEQLDRKLGMLRVWIGVGTGTLIGEQYDSLIAAGKDLASNTIVSPDDLFTIMYTSGTTGNPKGVMLPHSRLFAGTVYSVASLHPRPDDIKLQAVPQFHAGGKIYQLTYFAAGCTIVIMPRWDTDAALDAIENEGITIGSFVPSMLMMLLENPRIRRTDFGRLKRIVYGAAPIAEDRLALAMEITGASFQQTYGQTESGVLVSVLDEADHRKGLLEDRHILRSCGRQMLGYEIEVADEDGNLCANGVVGELRIRSSSLMSGYWKRPEATTKTLVGDWLYTGDLGYRDDRGYFYVVDRKNDMIISGGENVYPIEIENVISAHPDVLEVAVIGVPDQRWGQAVKAVVVVRQSRKTDPDSILNFCRGKLAGFKIPKSVDFIDSIPRNASGKITKNPLRDKYYQGQTRKI